MAATIAEMDFSLLGTPADMRDGNRVENAAQLIASQHNVALSSSHGSSTAPAFGSENEGMLGHDLQGQCYPTPLSFNCQCTPLATSNVSPAQSLSYWSDLGCHRQMQTQQEVPQGQQNGYQLSPGGGKRDRTALSSTYFSDPSGSDQVRAPKRHKQGDSRSVNSSDSGLEVGIPGALSVTALLETDDSRVSGAVQSTRTDLEDRFGRILDIVEEAGFDSFDSMAAQYYTAKFRENTTPHCAQSLSRSRHLRRLLASLHDSTKDWSSRETQGYREEIIRSAESIYVEELRRFKQSNVREKSLSTQGAVGGSENNQPAAIAEKTVELSLAKATSSLLKQGSTLLQGSVSLPPARLHLNPLYQPHPGLADTIQVPEIWSLLTELARNAGLTQPQRSQAACAFLCILNLR